VRGPALIARPAPRPEERRSRGLRPGRAASALGARPPPWARDLRPGRAPRAVTRPLRTSPTVRCAHLSPSLRLATVPDTSPTDASCSLGGHVTRDGNSRLHQRPRSQPRAAISARGHRLRAHLRGSSERIT
jgi:hypothetical protein